MSETEHIIREIDEEVKAAIHEPGLTPDERRKRQRELDREGTKADCPVW
jgi:hypothetical protein